MALCVTTRAQARSLWPESWQTARIYAVRAVGYALLALSGVAWMMSQGAAMGFASWLFCVLPLAALPLIFAWPYWPRRLIALGILLVPLAAIGMAICAIDI
ncbi:DUF3325 family protein [Steroidobacter flavus]|uniref:DUF3325 family protein n=1 Tax=Steroidobacter flavus TaxID=1842136 RepID=A0ABV8SZP9_9GAMM